LEAEYADKPQVGCILGLIINGYITEWIGYKKTMVVSMIVMTGAIFIPFFSTSLEMFLVGGIIQGLPWGGEYLKYNYKEINVLNISSLPDPCHLICSRSLPNTSSRIHDVVDQHVLGHWRSLLDWCAHWSDEEH
jgi:hypothetical protein